MGNNLKNIMKKLLLCCATGFLVLFLSGCANSGEIGQATSQIDNQQANDFDLQIKCADVANKASEQYTSITSYENHWNKSLGKCFVKISVGTSCGNGKTVFDVVEDRDYAMYYPCNKECQVSKNGNPNDMQTCHSEAEFDKLVQFYMNN